MLCSVIGRHGSGKICPCSLSLAFPSAEGAKAKGAVRFAGTRENFHASTQEKAEHLEALGASANSEKDGGMLEVQEKRITFKHLLDNCRAHRYIPFHLESLLIRR
jgi:hypothetical protein